MTMFAALGISICLVFLRTVWAIGSSTSPSPHRADLSFLQHMRLDESPSGHTFPAWENRQSPEFQFGNEPHQGKELYRQVWENLTKKMESHRSQPTSQHQKGTFEDNRSKRHVQDPAILSPNRPSSSQNLILTGYDYRLLPVNQLPTSSLHPAPSIHVPQDGLTVLNDTDKAKTMRREKIRPGRFRGFDWQKEISRKNQTIIYRRVREFWQPYDQRRYRLAYASLRKIMTVELANKIMQGDLDTIRQIGMDTYYGERARKAKSSVKVRTPYVRNKWPDPNLSFQEKKIIMKNLREYWKERGDVVRSRLGSHYQSRLATALMSSIDTNSFKGAADYLLQRTIEGTRSGSHRLSP